MVNGGVIAGIVIAVCALALLIGGTIMVVMYCYTYLWRKKKAEKGHHAVNGTRIVYSKAQPPLSIVTSDHGFETIQSKKAPSVYSLQNDSMHGGSVILQPAYKAPTTLAYDSTDNVFMTLPTRGRHQSRTKKKSRAKRILSDEMWNKSAKKLVKKRPRSQDGVDGPVHVQYPRSAPMSRAHSLVLDIDASAREAAIVRLRRGTVWIRPWLGRRVMLGQYDSLLQELEIDDIRAFKSFLRVEPVIISELLARVGPRIEKVSEYGGSQYSTVSYTPSVLTIQRAIPVKTKDKKIVYVVDNSTVATRPIMMSPDGTSAPLSPTYKYSTNRSARNSHNTSFDLVDYTNRHLFETGSQTRGHSHRNHDQHGGMSARSRVYSTGQSPPRSPNQDSGGVAYAVSAGGGHKRDHDTVHMQWSESMRADLADKDRRHHSDASSMASLPARRKQRAPGEHLYNYDLANNSLTQL